MKAILAAVPEVEKIGERCLSADTPHFHTDPDPTFHSNADPDLNFAVLRIRDILVRIRIRGSVPRTNGSGSGFGSCYFRN
jgi:hypothetical protein